MILEEIKGIDNNNTIKSDIKVNRNRNNNNNTAIAADAIQNKSI